MDERRAEVAEDIAIRREDGRKPSNKCDRELKYGKDHDQGDLPTSCMPDVNKSLAVTSELHQDRGLIFRMPGSILNELRRLMVNVGGHREYVESQQDKTRIRALSAQQELEDQQSLEQIRRMLENEIRERDRSDNNKKISIGRSSVQ
jgi:hypothetical protein